MNEDRNALENEVEAMNRQLRELADDELELVSGGGTLEDILREVSNWLDAHPNATKLDVYDELHQLVTENEDELTEEEMAAARQLLNNFAF